MSYIATTPTQDAYGLTGGELPFTGGDSGLLLIAGVFLIAAGGMIAGVLRRSA